MATVTVRARAPAMACVGGPGRLGSVSAGDLLRCSATRGAVASKPFLGPWTVHRASRRKRESRKRKFCTRKRSPLHCGGRGMPGDKAPPLGGPMGAVLGVLLRNYGFTDLPPSLHVPRSDPVTRITESSYRRLAHWVSALRPVTRHILSGHSLWGRGRGDSDGRGRMCHVCLRVYAVTGSLLRAVRRALCPRARWPVRRRVYVEYGSLCQDTT